MSMSQQNEKLNAHPSEKKRVLGPDDKFHVKDEYGNVYEMNDFPSETFLKRRSDGKMELHLVFLTKEKVRTSKKEPF